jgi:dolichol kinase
MAGRLEKLKGKFKRKAPGTKVKKERFTKFKSKLHAEREKLQKRWARLQAKKEDYKLELKRQTVHAIGVIAIILLLMFEAKQAVPILAALTGVVMIANWYLARRSWREKYFHGLIHELGLPHHDAESWKNASSNTQDFEQTVIWGLLRNFVRHSEKEPLLATFRSLLSALLAAVIFGVPFAIWGLIALSIGDSVSTIVGKKWGKIKIFWNKDKSYVGFVSFAISTLIAGIVFLNYFPQYAIAFNPPTLVVFVALIGALIETIPAVDDNSTIPFGVALALYLTTLL